MTSIKEQQKKRKIDKILMICSKGTIEDVYAALVMANGAVMEGIETKLFFTFFGMDAIVKKRQNKLHTATVGNPALRMPNGIRMPGILGILPGVEAGVSSMMKKQMEKLDVPPVDEFLDMITAGGGEVYACQMAYDMFKLKRDDLSEHVKDVITVGDLYDMADTDHTHIIFT
ncbi:MAG: DsrE/DsrF/DrsH-like family protein [Bacteroidota bacterium]